MSSYCVPTGTLYSVYQLVHCTLCTDWYTVLLCTDWSSVSAEPRTDLNPHLLGSEDALCWTARMLPQTPRAHPAEPVMTRCWCHRTKLDGEHIQDQPGLTSTSLAPKSTSPALSKRFSNFHSVALPTDAIAQASNFFCIKKN